MTKTKGGKFKPKQMSNPYSTSGVGYDLEHAVQASFVVLMLSQGIFSPVSSKHIVKIQLQNRIRDIYTDDLTVYYGDSDLNIYNKMFAQIKRSVQISRGNKNFRETIETTWLDFKGNSFNESIDKLALITTPMSNLDNTCIKTLLNFASGATDENEFMLMLNQKGHCNKNTTQKLNIIRSIIEHANDDKAISDNELWRFLKVFNVFIYDLDIKGVSLALLHSIIEQYECNDSSMIWSTIKDFVTEMNAKVGTITINNVPDNIKKYFVRKKENIIPLDLVPPKYMNENIYTNVKYKKALALASLIGSWSEYNINDKAVVSSVIDQDYESWIKILQEIEQIENAPVCYKKNIWTIKNRKEVLKNTQSAIYDSDIERLQTEVIKVLTELDPKYDLEKDKRFFANVYEKIYKYSYNLQKGLSETVALLGCSDYKFDHAENKVNYFANNVLHAIFNNPSWQHIATLNEYIPTLAESAPSEFITIINSLCNNNSIIMSQLIEQEGDGITGGCYISGLLWALERLAWNPSYYTDAILLLGKLAEITPSGRWNNRPENSITEILMPWHYQTLASIDMQKITVARLIREHSNIATQVLIKLLPEEHQIAYETNKPQYMNIFPDNWEYSIKVIDRNELVSHYITLLIEQTKGNINNIIQIIDHLNILSDNDFEKIVKIMSSKRIINATEERRVKLWNSLLSEIKNHKRFKKAPWSMSKTRINKLEKVLDLIKPKDLINEIAPLFNIQLNYNIDDEKKDYKKVEEKLNKQRENALIKLLEQKPNIKTIINLIQKVESPFMVSDALVNIKKFNFDNDIYPKLLKTKEIKIEQFLSNYTLHKYKISGLTWLKQISYKNWTINEQVEFFKKLPSCSEIWHLLNNLPKNIRDQYWETVDINPYQSDSDIDLIHYLLKYNRPVAATECISKMLHSGQKVESPLIIEILNKISSKKEEIRHIDAYTIGLMIKKLQDDKNVNSDDIVWFEWRFYHALNHVTKPTYLKKKLKEQPEFFCELINMLYKPKDEKIAKTEPILDQKLISHAWTILNEIKPLAGYDDTLETFDSKMFLKWFKKVIKIAKEKTRLEVTLNEIGQILFYTPEDKDGFWIDRNIAELLNTEEYEAMRRGYSSEVINSRGVHTVDPTAKPEFDFAAMYHKQADDCRSAGFNRLASILDDAEKFYQEEAKRILEYNNIQ